MRSGEVEARGSLPAGAPITAETSSPWPPSRVCCNPTWASSSKSDASWSAARLNLPRAPAAARPRRTEHATARLRAERDRQSSRNWFGAPNPRQCRAL